VESTTVSRPTSFNNPLLLGFDRLDQLLDHVTKSSGDYPPYNIEQIGEHGLRITLAVAGFALDDLTVTIEHNQLIIRGRKPASDRQRVYLHRGIASRQFQRTFVLSDGIEVNGASLDSGLLHVELQRRLPQPEARTIRIDRGPKGTGTSPGGAARVIEVTPEE
jgi:HSP20 family molecular chaperone IbpA